MIARTPNYFKEAFGTKVTTVIDCFEVFIEKPKNLRSAAETWSSYKHHSSVKILIAIVPRASVCFISESWGGRASDKFVTESSDFFKTACLRRSGFGGSGVHRRESSK